MSERPTPYVGVSGVINPEQQARLHEIWDSCNVPDRTLALGVKAVYKTQWLDIENKYGSKWYPVGDEVSSALAVDRTDELRVAQVYMDTGTLRRSGASEIDFIKKLFDRTGDMFNAVQFDMLSWDKEGKTELFEYIKTQRPGMEIFLQAHAEQMRVHGTEELVRRLTWYSPPGPKLVDRVLFDASHGTGKRLNVRELEYFLREAQRKTNLGIGIAGGLNEAVVLEDLPTLLKYYPKVSFDAEGQLHKNPDGSVGLNMQATEAYLRAAAEVLKTSES